MSGRGEMTTRSKAKKNNGAEEEIESVVREGLGTKNRLYTRGKVRDC